MDIPGKLSVLTIGNSFSESLKAYWQQAVDSTGCQLEFDGANIGGCELHRHWHYIEEEKDPNCRIYKSNRYKMREMLAMKQWDIVTIQQASHASWKPETYQPFAQNIIDYIHQYAPQAEIVIQQTWAYRADDPRLCPDRKSYWGIDQTGMYDRLTAAYKKLSKDSGNLRIIPTGLAVQLTRQNQGYHFQNYTPASLHQLRWPDLPSQAGDTVGKLFWGKNHETGSFAIYGDHIHLNIRGQYLQACVWFAFLFHRSAEDILFIPDEIDNNDAVFLQKMANRAVCEFK
ncbi:MAG: DUF4886 domain-containing protein [Lentisphaeria bacterium]